MTLSSRISGHIRSSAVGYVALFFALSGGVAWATHPEGANTISSEDIIGGEVKVSDISANAFASDDIVKVTSGWIPTTRFEIANDAIQGSEVSSNTVTGSDVYEPTLGKVPSATQADTLAGLSVRPVEFQAPVFTSPRTILSVGGLKLTGSCGSDGDIEIIATTSKKAILQSSSDDVGAQQPPNNRINDGSFALTDEHDLLSQDEHAQSGQTVYAAYDGNVVVVNWASDEDAVSGYEWACTFVGTATQH